MKIIFIMKFTFLKSKFVKNVENLKNGEIMSGINKKYPMQCSYFEKEPFFSTTGIKKKGIVMEFYHKCNLEEGIICKRSTKEDKLGGSIVMRKYGKGSKQFRYFCLDCARKAGKL